MFDNTTNDNGLTWLILIFVLLFGGGIGGIGGYGRNAAGIGDNYVLASDFATIQRQLSDGFNSIDNALDRQNAGICDLGFTQAQLINGLGQTVSNGFATAELARSNDAMRSQEQIFGVQKAISDCCCDNRFAIAGLQNAMQSGFCNTNYNAQSNTRDIIDSQNAGTQAIIAKLCEMENSAKDDKIAALTAQNQSLQLAASQTAQNAYLIRELSPKLPIPAFTVPNPYGCNCNYGFNGTTIV